MTDLCEYRSYSYLVDKTHSSREVVYDWLATAHWWKADGRVWKYQYRWQCITRAYFIARMNSQINEFILQGLLADREPKP